MDERQEKQETPPKLKTLQEFLQGKSSYELVHGTFRINRKLLPKLFYEVVYCKIEDPGVGQFITSYASRLSCDCGYVLWVNDTPRIREAYGEPLPYKVLGEDGKDFNVWVFERSGDCGCK